MSTDNLNSYRYVLIGASAGGFRAVVQCLGGFRGRENVVFVVVLHGYSESPETLAAHLEKLIDMLEDSDDVQGVFHNWGMDEE